MTTETPWFEQWFDENYLLLYTHRDHSDAAAQVRLIIDTVHITKDTSILDLACGEGRYTYLFHEKGYHITGIDLSETLVNSGIQKHPHLDLRVGDKRDIQGRYDLILSLFTSFGYFETDDENEQVLRSVYHALKPGGTYWLDFLNVEQVAAQLIPETVTQLTEDIRVVEHRRIENGRIIKDIQFLQGTAPPAAKEAVPPPPRTYHESVRLFTCEELTAMFERSGFEVTHCFGDYRGNKRTHDSPRTIVVGRKY